MAIAQPLTGANFVDPIMPIITNDTMLSAGSLCLVDFAHSIGGPATGVPVNGTRATNIAVEQAAAMIGSGDATTLAPTWALNGLAADDAVIERSGKKGVHVIFSQANDEAGDYVRLDLPTPIKNYLIANPGHSYFMSIWERITRQAIDDTTIDPFSFGIAAPTPGPLTSNYLMFQIKDQVYPSGGGPTSLGSRGGASALGNNIRNVAASGAAGAGLGTLANLLAAVAWGMPAGVFNTYSLHKSRSSILYRMYLEDLTVSGRAYATVDALDLAAYTAAFAAGGRYNGDTFTDPTTLA